MNLRSRIIRAACGTPPDLGSRTVTLLVCAFFGAGGVFALTSLFLTPLFQSIAAQDWQQVEGELISPDTDQETEHSSIATRYRYQIDGREYVGERFSFDQATREFADEMISDRADRYQPGVTISVWVDPADPGESVLDREIRWTNYLGLLFSLPFLGMGALGTVWALFAGRRYRKCCHLRAAAAERAATAGARHIAGLLRTPAAWSEENRAIIFSDGQDRANRLGVLGICLFWNSVLSVFLFVLAMVFVSGAAYAWWGVLILSPFILIGLFLLNAVRKEFTRPRSPDYVFLLSPIIPVPEEMRVRIEWVFIGEQHPGAELSELGIGIARSKGSSALPKKKWEIVSEPEFKTMTEADPDLRRGETEVILPEAKKRTLLGGRLKFGFQGATDLFVRWKQRNHATQEVQFELASVGDEA